MADYKDMIEEIFEGEGLDFSDLVGQKMKDSVKVGCSLHGEFSRTVEHLLQGKGCPACESNFRASIKDLSPKEQFIAKANVRHKGKYGYSKVVYASYKEKVEIVCPEHGSFWQKPVYHLQGTRCPGCGRDQAAKSRAMSVEDFKVKATEIHQGKYDYSEVKFNILSDDVTIGCPVHGNFTQKANNHLSGRGCYLCRNEVIGDSKRSNKEEFVAKAIEVHGDRYDYSSVEYIRNHDKVNILCKKHGMFEQTPSGHLSGKGCPKCARELVVSAHLHTQEEFLERSRSVHGDKYDYSKSVFDRAEVPLVITCPEHGDFEKKPTLHWAGQGCPVCSREVMAEAMMSDNQSFIEAAEEIHGKGTYDYSKVEYQGVRESVEIVCPKHGSFPQKPNDHLDGHGCPACGRSHNGRSRACEELVEFLKSLGVEVEQEKRIHPDRQMRSDVFLPDQGVFIEYNGLRWHSTRFVEDRSYHATKSKLAADAGKRMVHIFEDEWLHRQHAVKHLLTYLVGKLPTVAARKTTVVTVDPKVAKSFYENYHIQGFSGKPELTYGLMLEGELVACMSFSTKTSNRKNPYGEGLWELIRFASKYAVAGGASKLFKHFLRNNEVNTVVSFSMNHIFSGNMYKELGFTLDKMLPIDYTYVDTKALKRVHKSAFQLSRLKKRFAKFDPNLTEEENCKNHNFYRIYDCGKKRWVYKV